MEIPKADPYKTLTQRGSVPARRLSAAPTVPVCCGRREIVRPMFIYSAHRLRGRAAGFFMPQARALFVPQAGALFVTRLPTA
jgi:hypothetical protein